MDDGGAAILVARCSGAVVDAGIPDQVLEEIGGFARAVRLVAHTAILGLWRVCEPGTLIAKRPNVLPRGRYSSPTMTDVLLLG